MMEIKVGDKVLVSYGSGFNHRYEICTVERETATLWIVAGEKYSKEHLGLSGNRYRGGIEALTPEAQRNYDEWNEENLHNKFWRNIQNIKRPYHLSAKRLQEIYGELKG